MKTINLEEILAKWVSYNLQQLGRSKEASDAVAKTSIEEGTYWYIMEAMRECAKQALELAARNVTCSEEHQYDENDNEFLICKIDRDSITNTINQVK